MLKSSEIKYLKISVKYMTVITNSKVKTLGQILIDGVSCPSYAQQDRDSKTECTPLSLLLFLLFSNHSDTKTIQWMGSGSPYLCGECCKTLQLSKEEGGQSSPCLMDFYKATRVRWLACCCKPAYEVKWKNSESSQLDIPLQAVLGGRALYERHCRILNQ